MKKLFIDFDLAICTDEVLSVLETLKKKDESEEGKTKSSGDEYKVIDEGKEAKKRDTMIKEAVSLSEESSMDLGSIIKEYTRYRIFMQV